MPQALVNSRASRRDVNEGMWLRLHFEVELWDCVSVHEPARQLWSVFRLWTSIQKHHPSLSPCLREHNRLLPRPFCYSSTTHEWHSLHPSPQHPKLKEKQFLYSKSSSPLHRSHVPWHCQKSVQKAHQTSASRKRQATHLLYLTGDCICETVRAEEWGLVFESMKTRRGMIWMTGWVAGLLYQEYGGNDFLPLAMSCGLARVMILTQVDWSSSCTMDQ